MDTLALNLYAGLFVLGLLAYEYAVRAREPAFAAASSPYHGSYHHGGFGQQQYRHPSSSAASPLRQLASFSSFLFLGMITFYNILDRTLNLSRSPELEPYSVGGGSSSLLFPVALPPPDTEPSTSQTTADKTVADSEDEETTTSCLVPCAGRLTLVAHPVSKGGALPPPTDEEKEEEEEDSELATTQNRGRATPKVEKKEVSKMAYEEGGVDSLLEEETFEDEIPDIGQGQMVGPPLQGAAVAVDESSGATVLHDFGPATAEERSDGSAVAELLSKWAGLEGVAGGKEVFSGSNGPMRLYAYQSKKKPSNSDADATQSEATAADSPEKSSAKPDTGKTESAQDEKLMQQKQALPQTLLLAAREEKAERPKRFVFLKSMSGGEGEQEAASEGVEGATSGKSSQISKSTGKEQSGFTKKSRSGKTLPKSPPSPSSKSSRSRKEKKPSKRKGLSKKSRNN